MLLEGIGGLGMMVFALLTPFLNPGRRRWGMQHEELTRRCPGDDLVRHVRGYYDHAVTINASAADIWPWLVQIGQDKAGFYSYEMLERMIGCKIKNADSIVPEYQDLEVGNAVPMHPTMGWPYTVASFEPERFLVLQIQVDTKTGKSFNPDEGYPARFQDSSWAFILEENGGGTTRLISRSRNNWDDTTGTNLFYNMFGPLTLMMDRKMLLGIKKRAESGRSKTR